MKEYILHPITAPATLTLTPTLDKPAVIARLNSDDYFPPVMTIKNHQ